ncbi:MAG: hypothetical protein BRD40_04395 [Bacteroidetes bacterium QS_1_65_9]|nr:MAG: hypothetical protein BRD40_04395 [Bacteroidetes bacterium QS_1_65_9]
MFAIFNTPPAFWTFNSLGKNPSSIALTIALTFQSFLFFLHLLNLLLHLPFRELVPAVLTAAGFQLDVFGAHRTLLVVLVGIELLRA